MSDEKSEFKIQPELKRFDKLTPQQRSALMAKVHSKDTKPEEIVRKALFRQNFRYRKNVSTMHGKPDIVLPKYRAVVFIHGCFWHQHSGCKEAVRPKTRQDYWETKLNRNIERDASNIAKLEELGWRVFVIWECELRPCNRQQTITRLIENLRLLNINHGKC